LLTPFPETSGGGGARAGRRLGPGSWRIAARCPPGLEQQHHADLCLGCKPRRPQRAEEGCRLLGQSQPTPSSQRLAGGRAATAASTSAAPSGGCGKRREPDAGAGGERASVRTGSERRGGARQGRGQRADPAEPPAAQRRRALPDRGQRGHGQRQGIAELRSSPVPGLGGGWRMWPRAVTLAAATAWLARLRLRPRSSALCPALARGAAVGMQRGRLGLSRV
jgi:hypothetical protein